MLRLKCKVEYDGTQYAGYQVQPNGRTIQEEIEKALTQMHKGERIRITASGRTDAGVHAIGQTIHFDTSLNIPAENWKRALSSMLPSDIRVANVEPVSKDFHARYDTTAKEYRYYVWNEEDANLFRRQYSYHIRKPLNIEAMDEACKRIEGEHNFTSFCSPRTDVKGSKVRTITRAAIEQQGSELVFVFTGTGFLYNMVRILVGTILEVGLGTRNPADITEILKAQDRKAAGKTAPPHGLFLWKVEY